MDYPAVQCDKSRQPWRVPFCFAPSGHDAFPAAGILCLKVVRYAVSMLGALHCISVCVSYWLALSHRRWRVCPLDDPLCGQMVKASSSVMADPGFESRFLPGDFSGSSNTSDLNIGTPVATCQVLGL